MPWAQLQTNKHKWWRCEQQSTVYLVSLLHEIYFGSPLKCLAIIQRFFPMHFMYLYIFFYWLHSQLCVEMQMKEEANRKVIHLHSLVGVLNAVCRLFDCTDTDEQVSSLRGKWWTLTDYLVYWSVHIYPYSLWLVKTYQCLT